MGENEVAFAVQVTVTRTDHMEQECIKARIALIPSHHLIIFLPVLTERLR